MGRAAGCQPGAQAEGQGQKAKDAGFILKKWRGDIEEF